MRNTNKMITLENLYDIWYKHKSKIYTDSKSYYDIYFLFFKDTLRINPMKYEYDSFGELYNNFKLTGWSII